jgi:hypothetical protein
LATKNTGTVGFIQTVLVVLNVDGSTDSNLTLLFYPFLACGICITPFCILICGEIIHSYWHDLSMHDGNAKLGWDIRHTQHSLGGILQAQVFSKNGAQPV